VTTYSHPVMACPNCGVKLDAATDVIAEGPPAPGDLSICIDCMSLLVYDWENTIRLMTDDELALLALNYPQIFRLLCDAQNAIAAVKADGKQPQAVQN